MTSYRFNGKIIKIPETGYLNLSTNRVLKETSKKIKELVCDKELKVCGTEEDIKNFKKENFSKEVKEEKRGFKPTEYALNVAIAAANALNRVNQIADIVKQTSPRKREPQPKIEEIEIEDLVRIPLFSMDGYFTKAAIVRILDADTFELAFYYHNPGYKGKGEGWMLIRDTVRLYGINSAEKMGEEKKLGLEAKKQVIEKLKPFPYIWAEFRTYDKYGRILADIYLDESKKTSLNDWILNIKCSKTGVCLVKEYYGKKKEKFDI